MIKFLETFLKTLLLLGMLFIIFIIFVNCGGPQSAGSTDEGLYCNDNPPTLTCAPTCNNEWVRVINGTETRFPSEAECIK